MQRCKSSGSWLGRTLSEQLYVSPMAPRILSTRMRVHIHICIYTYIYISVYMYTCMCICFFMHVFPHPTKVHARPMETYTNLTESLEKVGRLWVFAGVVPAGVTAFGVAPSCSVPRGALARQRRYLLKIHRACLRGASGGEFT